jgi:hypothetical protein
VRIVWPGQVRQFPSTNVAAGYDTDTLTVNQTYVPAPPTISSVVANSATQVTVNYTAPTTPVGSAITGYTLNGSPGNIAQTISTAGSYFFVVPGLTQLSTYTFAVYAINAYGTSTFSSSASATTYVASSSTAFTTPGTYSWTVPTNVSAVSVVVVGGGGGGLNSPSLFCSSTPSNGGQSYFGNTGVVYANGGTGAYFYSGGTIAAGFGGTGGGAPAVVTYAGGAGAQERRGGGGAGGYAGAGGASSVAAAPGTGAGGGGAYLFPAVGGGGGVGLFGRGADGAAGSTNGICTVYGKGGSGGGDASCGGGGTYGGGGGGASFCSFRGASAGGGALAYLNNYAVTPGAVFTVVVGAGANGSGSLGFGPQKGAPGAVRIVWPGNAGARAFPSTNVNTI